MNTPHIDKLLEKEYDKLVKDSQRLEVQIETCEDMIHNSKLKLKEINNKIQQISHIDELKKTF